jgi:beta-N-acetylhexosaminidase
MKKDNFKKSLTICLIIVLFFGCNPAAKKETDKSAAAEWAEKTLAGLTLEKKVAQLICTDITGVYIPDDDPRFQSWLELAGDYGIGGFVLYGGTPHNVARLLNRLQAVAEIPVLISADFEGGPGQQVTGASEFPGNMGFAATRDEKLMYEAAKIMATEGRAMGIHLTYTPVSDVSLFPENPQESVRSFGGDLELIGRMLKAYVKGYEEMGMITTAKHFPGRGDMKPYPAHPGFNYLDKPAEELEDNEFRAFKYAVDAGVRYIMTEHVAVPSVTGGSELPASVEPKLVKGIIRDMLHFDGIITTDDLWYDHVVERFGQEEVAIKALEAGHDILLKPKDPVAAIQYISNAVREGRLRESRIDSSAYKLLYQKALLGLHKNRYVDETRIGTTVGTITHREVIQKVADKSITLLKNDNVLPLHPDKDGNIVHITLQKYNNQDEVNVLVNQMASAFGGIKNFSLRPDMDEAYYHGIEMAVKNADLVVLSFFIQRDRYGDPAPVRKKDLELIRKIIAAKPNAVIAMSYGNPHLIRKIENVPAFLCGWGEGGWYGNQKVYFDSFIRLMKGELSPTGKLPLAVSNEYQIGFGLTY